MKQKWGPCWDRRRWVSLNFRQDSEWAGTITWRHHVGYQLITKVRLASFTGLLTTSVVMVTYTTLCFARRQSPAPSPGDCVWPLTLAVAASFDTQCAPDQRFARDWGFNESTFVQFKSRFFFNFNFFFLFFLTVGISFRQQHPAEVGQISGL